jgi:hypothetical protein
MLMGLARVMAFIGVSAAIIASFITWFIVASGERLRLKLVVRVFAGTMAVLMVVPQVLGALEKMSEGDFLLMVAGLVIGAVLWFGRRK